VETRVALLELAAKNPSNDKKAWQKVIDGVLTSEEPKIVAAALRLAVASQSALSSVVTNTSLPASIRVEALRQIPVTNRFNDSAHFKVVLSSLNPTNPASIRLAAAGLLSPAQAEQIPTAIKNDPLVRPFIDRSATFTGDQQKLLDELAPLLAGGDENRGQQLFPWQSQLHSLSIGSEKLAAWLVLTLHVSAPSGPAAISSNRSPSPAPPLRRATNHTVSNSRPATC
jgi:hypothetical protein